MAVFNSASVKRNFPASMDSDVADKDYYVDKDGNLVEGTDEKAAFLVAAKGSSVPKDVAERYGIQVGAESTEGDEGKAAKPAAKATAPSENKGAKK